MKATQLMMGIVLAGTLATYSEDVVIQSFEIGGKLTFNEVPDATKYQVDWTTNLNAPAWASNAPGIAERLATGVGDAVVTVGLGQAFCLYRVTATVSNPPAMVLIPAGSFVMGNATNVLPADDGPASELPQHTVNVSGFYMDRYEVTKALWDEVKTWADTNGYAFDNAGSGKAIDHPVHTVNWYDVVKWCNARSEKEGLTPCYTTNGVTCRSGNDSNVVCHWTADGYRLPTEAEWEKAARGGVADTRFPWTDYTNRISHAKGNYLGNSAIINYDLSSGSHPAYTNGGVPYTSPAGNFAPNGYGLYDMAGNMWEWCWDWYSSTYYSSSPGTDPTGPDSGSYRMLRGGTWAEDARHTRCAHRNGDYADYEHNSMGFRCAKGL
jgi:formylglycine-generating enzyme